MKLNFIFLLLCLFIFSGCSINTSNAKNASPAITVAAAGSLTNAFTELGAAFEQHNDVKVSFVFGSTGMLSEQIRNGAPYDIIAAADEVSIENLYQKGFIYADSINLYAIGRIGIVSNKKNLIHINTLDDLLKPEIVKIAIATPEHAPYGLAAKEALVSSGLWDHLESKIVYGKNISEALTFVTTGNAEVGIIALSLKDEELNFNIIDDNLHTPLYKSMAVTTNAQNEKLARSFINFVISTEGQEIMSKYGLISPEE
ncbi:molybdate transport system substrate-binding protein [Natranaerovirga pectinivora]|uniref:Molybdate transport system substrate-binding protein n=1 Tax=Natranaerovirga pectinivora TaxID=682400 RepID=A0A4R3MNE8_9FIRM|nr:molybdate ABC transporter substrate-binding protein [Natranaerovirga pectinivora]TCT16767.1 molybdate transport system substrate-binding protein [Natranaerovirga pectinivora]